MCDQVWPEIDGAPGNDFIRVHRLEIYSENKRQNSTIEMGAPFDIDIYYWNMSDVSKIVLNIYFLSLDGTTLFKFLNIGERLPRNQSAPILIRTTCSVPPHLFNEGDFILRINFLNEHLGKLFDFTDAACFSIRDLNRREIAVYGRFAGHIHPQLTWHSTLIRS